MNKELKELSETFANISKEFKELRAGMDMPSADPKNHDMMNRMMDNMYAMINNVHNRIDKVDQQHWQNMDNHMSASTHLPKLSASQHEKLLKSCGASEDYNVIKPSIFASRNRQGNPQFEVDLIKPTK